jgi:hypothetical protein
MNPSSERGFCRLSSIFSNVPSIPLQDLIVFRSSLYQAFDDCERGHCSHSKGPIEVFHVGDNKYQLLDGHHRLVEYLLNQKHLTNSHTIPVKVRTGPITLDYAVADFDERWEYDGNLKYGNLEDLADEEIIDDLVVELFHINEAKIDTLLNYLFETMKPNNVLYHGSPNKFDHFEQKPWKAFDGKTITAPIWLSPNKKFAAANAGLNGWVYEVATHNLHTFPDQDLRLQKGNYIVPSALGEKLLEDMITTGMFGLGDDDWYEAEEILKSIDRLDYDVLETGDFIEWLKKNGYNSFMVRGDGPTNIAVLDANNIKILRRYKKD